jgi:hypothetical protein
MRQLPTFVLVLTACSACATLIRGSTQAVRLESDPPGASAFVDGQTFTTPAEVQLGRSAAHVVRFSKPGYEDAERVIGQRMSTAWTMLDAFFAIPLMVDLSTGSLEDLDPSIVDVHLNEHVR